MNPDAIIKVRFRTKAEGGRGKSIWGAHFSCPMNIGREGFDCRIFPEGRTLEPGIWYEVPIKFLFPENAAPKLRAAGEFTLWEGKTIADGQLLKMCSDADCNPITSPASPEHSSAAPV